MFKNLIRLLLAIGATTALAAPEPSNTFRIGDGSASNKKILAITGQATPPSLRWSQTDNEWQFSSDGVSFSAMGSGSGSGSGVNVLINAGFESGITQGWSNTGGTFVAVSAGSNLLIGKGSATFTAAGSGNSVLSPLYDVPVGLQGGNCSASMLYKGGSSNLKFQVLDASSNVLNEQVLTAASVARTVQVVFQCPVSGQFRVKLIASAVSPLIAMDQMKLGDSSIVSLSQAEFVGSISYNGASACEWTTTAASPDTFYNFNVDTDCATPTVEGRATAPGTKIPAIVFPNLPPGRYRVEARGRMTYETPTGSTAFQTFRLHDGTNALEGVAQAIAVNSGNLHRQTGQVLIGDIEYTTTQSNLTIQLQGSTSDTGNKPVVSNVVPNIDSLVISVFKYPSTEQSAMAFDTAAWKAQLLQISASVAGNMGTGSATNLHISDSDLTNTVPVGSQGSFVPCSGSNDSVGLTCGAGTMQIGIATNVPIAGPIEVCADFIFEAVSSVIQDHAPTGSIEWTQNATESVIATGGNEWIARHQIATNAFKKTDAAIRLCSVFNITNVGKQTFRLNYNQSANSTTYNGIFQALWTVRPLNQQTPAPLVVNGVVNPGTGVLNIAKARIADAATESTVCSSSPCTVWNSTGSWLSSVTRTSTGIYVLNFAASQFSSAPSCQASGNNGVNGIVTQSGLVTTTSSASYIFSLTDGTVKDVAFDVTCVGIK